MKPEVSTTKLRPSLTENDPHPSTEEIGRDEDDDTAHAPKDRRERELEEERRVNNGVHDGERYLRR